MLTALAIGAVGVLAGYMVAIGRPADDLEAVIASRYASTAALAWVAVVLVSGHLMPRRGVAVSVALVGALAISHTDTWAAATRFSDELTTARATVLDGRHVTWEVIESFMDYRRLPEAAGWLDALRARGLSLYRGASVEQRRVSTAEPLRVPTCRLAEGPVPFEAYGAGGVPGNACALAWHLPGGRAVVERGVFDSHGQVTFSLPTDRMPDAAVIQIIGLDRFMRLAPSKTVTLKR
ncbi:MAG: hypothetical protein HRU14_18085 [Planctomycetes bacterium]|nr:hypothetical protein [Planctomycetota bacterium]